MIRLLLILFIVGLLCYAANAQPDLSHMKAVGQKDGVAFFYDRSSVTPTHFKGLMAVIDEEPAMLDANHYILSEFSYTCDYRYSILSFEGRWGGKHQKITKPTKEATAKPGTMIYHTITAICGVRV